MKKFTKIISLISVEFALVGVALLNTSQSSQASYVGKSSTCTWKSAANITTGWFTIHGRGYSYPNSGKVLHLLGLHQAAHYLIQSLTNHIGHIRLHVEFI